MNPALREELPVALTRTWVNRYNRFMFLAVALREFSRKKWPSGCLQDSITEAAWDVVDAADHLRAYGYAPQLWIAGDEAILWAKTVEFVCALPAGRTPPADANLAAVDEWASAVRSAWTRYAEFVGQLPDDCFANVSALQPLAFRLNGLAALVGEGGHFPVPPESNGKAGGKFLDPYVTVAKV